MPSIVPQLLVAGSITWTLSPAELVWMTRAVFRRQQRRHQKRQDDREFCHLHMRLHLLEPAFRRLTRRRAFSTPGRSAISSACPGMDGSPPASAASGCMSHRLAMGSPGLTRCQAFKILARFLFVPASGAGASSCNGACDCRGTPRSAHVRAAWPGRSLHPIAEKRVVQRDRRRRSAGSASVSPSRPTSPLWIVLDVQNLPRMRGIAARFGGEGMQQQRVFPGSPGATSGYHLEVRAGLPRVSMRTLPARGLSRSRLAILVCK